MASSPQSKWMTFLEENLLDDTPQPNAFFWCGLNEQADIRNGSFEQNVHLGPPHGSRKTRHSNNANMFETCSCNSSIKSFLQSNALSSAVLPRFLRLRIFGSMAASAPVLGTTQDAPRPINWTYELTPEDETEMQTAIEHFSGRTLVGRLVGTTLSRPTVREWIESALGGSPARLASL
ncbi:hypothetical protein L7F22_029893 [Adiantum nelumboides]|nr:hypothetical protein [Adiantum nelumboides]